MPGPPPLAGAPSSARRWATAGAALAWASVAMHGYMLARLSWLVLVRRTAPEPPEPGYGLLTALAELALLPLALLVLVGAVAGARLWRRLGTRKARGRAATGVALAAFPLYLLWVAEWTHPAHPFPEVVVLALVAAAPVFLSAAVCIWSGLAIARRRAL